MCVDMTINFYNICMHNFNIRVWGCLSPRSSKKEAQATPNRKCVTRVSYPRFSPPFTNQRQTSSGPIVAFHRLCGWPAPLTAATPTAPPRCAASSSCRRPGRGATSSSHHRSEGHNCFFHASPTMEVPAASSTRRRPGRYTAASSSHRRRGTTSSSHRRPGRARLLLPRVAGHGGARLLPHAAGHGGVRLLLPRVAGQGGA
jgi:hypothetical protein